MNAPMYDAHDAQEFADFLRAEINAPHVEANVSSLGGTATITVRVSLDHPDTWSNGIYHNSRGFMLSIYREGTIESFYTHGLPKKFRKTSIVYTTGENPWQKVVAKINKYISQVR